MLDVEATIGSQYANSPTIVQLIYNMNTYLSPAANIDAFYDLVWNVDTAQGYGLDVWGRIVGVNRVIPVTAGKYLGFDEATKASADPFNQSPFWGGDNFTTNFALSDDAFRTLIFAKALANITNCSIPAINQILLNLFPGLGDCFVTDGENMTMTYTFLFPLTPVQLAIVNTSGVLPKPAGVAVTTVVVPASLNFSRPRNSMYLL